MYLGRTEMRQNFFNPATHVGVQPVRVLKWNIAYVLENAHPAFAREFHAVLQRHGLAPCIAYDCSERGILERGFPDDQLVPHVDGKKQITIQETFLSMVWAMCYSHLALFEELHSKPILNHRYGHGHVVDQRAVRSATDLYRYGVGLVHGYTPWDKANLPNPEEYDDDADIYIGRTNAVFVFAMVFILCHEFAHIERGHCDDFIAKADRHLIEYEADDKAVDTMLKGGTNPAEKLTYKVGMVLGFCSLLTLGSALESETHPNLGRRIERILRALHLEDTSQLWGHATMSFKLWDDLHHGSSPRLSWPRCAVSFKELFYRVLEQVG